MCSQRPQLQDACHVPQQLLYLGEVHEGCIGAVNIYKYVLRSIPEPIYNNLLSTENTSYWAFVVNNTKIVALISVNISEIKQPYISHTKLADVSWAALKLCHQGCRPIIQMLLMQEAGCLLFGSDVVDLPCHLHYTKDLVS